MPIFKDKNEDIDVDSDIDASWGDELGEDLDFEALFGDPPKKDRKPVDEIKAGVTSGFKNATQPAEVTQTLKKVLPRHFRNTVTEASDIAGNAKQVLNEGLQDVAREMNTAKQNLLRATKLYEKQVPKFAQGIFGKLQNKLQSSIQQNTSTGNYKSETQQQLESISAELNINFNESLEGLGSQLVETQREIQKENAVREMVAEVAEKQRFQTQQELLLGIHKGITRSVNYQEKIAGTYARKQLEIGMLQLAVQRNIHSALVNKASIDKGLLENIQKNTALPDVVKYQKSEVMKDMLMRHTLGGMGNTLSAFIGNFKEQFTQNLLGQMKDRMGDASGMLNQLNSGADMGLGAVEMMREMGESKSFKETAASGIAGILARKLIKGLGKKAYSGVDGEQGRLSGLLQKGTNFVEFLPQNMMRLKEKDTNNKFFSFLQSLIPDYNQQVQSHSLTSRKNLSQPVPFDTAARTSLVDIIPQLLSKIHQSTEGIRTTLNPRQTLDEGALLEFDFDNARLSTKKQLDIDFQKKLYKSTAMEESAGSLWTIINIIDEHNFLGSELRRKIAYDIAQHADLSKGLNPEDFFNRDWLKSLSDLEYRTLVDHLTNNLGLVQGKRKTDTDNSHQLRTSALNRAAKTLLDNKQLGANFVFQSGSNTSADIERAVKLGLGQINNGTFSVNNRDMIDPYRLRNTLSKYDDDDIAQFQPRYGDNHVDDSKNAFQQQPGYTTRNGVEVVPNPLASERNKKPWLTYEEWRSYINLNADRIVERRRENTYRKGKRYLNNVLDITVGKANADKVRRVGNAFNKTVNSAVHELGEKTGANQLFKGISKQVQNGFNKLSEGPRIKAKQLLESAKTHYLTYGLDEQLTKVDKNLGLIFKSYVGIYQSEGLSEEEAIRKTIDTLLSLLSDVDSQASTFSEGVKSTVKSATHQAAEKAKQTGKDLYQRSQPYTKQGMDFVQDKWNNDETIQSVRSKLNDEVSKLKGKGMTAKANLIGQINQFVDDKLIPYYQNSQGQLTEGYAQGRDQVVKLADALLKKVKKPTEQDIQDAIQAASEIIEAAKEQAAVKGKGVKLKLQDLNLSGLDIPKSMLGHLNKLKGHRVLETILDTSKLIQFFGGLRSQFEPDFSPSSTVRFLGDSLKESYQQGGVKGVGDLVQTMGQSASSVAKDKLGKLVESDEDYLNITRRIFGQPGNPAAEDNMLSGDAKLNMTNNEATMEWEARSDSRNSEIFTVYVRGENTPRLLKSGFLTGRYIDEESKEVITEPADIKGVVLEAGTGEILISEDDIAKGLVDYQGKDINAVGLDSWVRNLSRKFSSTKNVMKGLGAVANKIYKAMTFIPNLTMDTTDVYLPQENDKPMLVLSRFKMMRGAYMNEDGSTIFGLRHIKGDIYNKDGTIVITLDEFKKCVDHKGRPLSKSYFIRRLRQTKDVLKFMAKPVTAPAKFLAKKAFKYLEKKGQSFSLRDKLGLTNLKERLNTKLGFNEEEGDNLDEHGRPTKRGFLSRAKGVLKQASSLRNRVQRKGGVVIDDYTGEARKGNFKERNEEQRREEKEKREADEARIKKEREMQEKRNEGGGIFDKILKGILGVGPMLLGGLTTLGTTILGGLTAAGKLITSGIGTLLKGALEWFGKKYLIGQAMDMAADALDDVDVDRDGKKKNKTNRGKGGRPKRGPGKGGKRGGFNKALRLADDLGKKGGKSVGNQVAKKSVQTATTKVTQQAIKTAGTKAAQKAAIAGGTLAAKQGLKIGVVAGAASFLGPVGLGLVGAAMALWTVWEVGSFIWDIVSSPNKIDHFRCAAYGINPSSDYRIKGVLKLEEAMMDVTKVDKETGKVTLDDKITDDLKEAMKFFMGGDAGNQKAQENPDAVEEWGESFQSWFDQRFKPAYIRHVEALHAVDPTIKLTEAFGAVMGDLKNGLVNTWLRKAWFDNDNPDNPYHIEIDPFFTVEDDDEYPTADAAMVKEYFDIVHKAYEVDEKRLNAKNEREKKNKPQGVVGTSPTIMPGIKGSGKGGIGAQVPTGPLPRPGETYQQGSNGSQPITGMGQPYSSNISKVSLTATGATAMQGLTNNLGDGETGEFAEVGLIKTTDRKSFKSNEINGRYIDPITALRMKVYGLTTLDQLTVKQLLELEMDLIMDTIIPTDGSYPRIPNHVVNRLRDKWAVRLGWKLTDQGQLETFTAWLKFRFLPVWFKFAQEVYRIGQNKDLFEALEKMNLFNRYELAQTLATLTVTYNGKDISVWELPMTAVFGEAPNMNADSVKENLDNLKTGWSGDEYLEPSNRMIPKTSKDSDSGSSTTTTSPTPSSNGEGGITNVVNNVLGGVASTIGATEAANGGGQGFGLYNPSGSQSGGGSLAYDPNGNYGKESNYPIKNVSPDKKAVAVALMKKMNELGWSETEKNLFMATIDEETGHLKYLTEQGSASYFAKKKYGAKWRGRGIIQLTHQDNYKKFADWVGRPEIMENPDLVASDPELAVSSGIYWWEDTKKRFKKFREAIANGDILNVSRAVNNGPGAIGNPNKTPNGIKKRFKYYQEYVNGKGFMQKLTGAEKNATGSESPMDAVVQNTNTNNPLEAEANNKVIDTSTPLSQVGETTSESSNPFAGGSNEGNVSTSMINFSGMPTDNSQAMVESASSTSTNEYSMSDTTFKPTYDDGTTGGKTVSNAKGKAGQLLAQATPELINLGKQSLGLNMSETLGRKPNPNEMNQDYMRLLYAAIGEYQMKKKGKGSFGTNQMHRTYQDQVRMKEKYGKKAAKPGKSNHGWGIAVDLNQNKATTDDFFNSGIAGKWGFHRPLLNWSVAKEWWHVENKLIGKPKGKKNGDFMGDSEASSTNASLTSPESVDGGNQQHQVLGGAPVESGSPLPGDNTTGFDGLPRHFPQTSGVSSEQVSGGHTPGFVPPPAPASGSSDPFRFGDIFTGQSDGIGDMVRKVSSETFGTDFDITNTRSSFTQPSASGAYANQPTANVERVKVLDDGARLGESQVVSTQQDFYNSQNKMIQTQQDTLNKQQQSLMDNVTDIMKEQLGVQKDIYTTLKEIASFVKDKAMSKPNPSNSDDSGSVSSHMTKRAVSGKASDPLLDVGIGGNPAFA